MFLGSPEESNEWSTVRYIAGWFSPFFFQILFFADLQPDSFPSIRLLSRWVCQGHKTSLSSVSHWNVLYISSSDISKLRSKSLNFLSSHSWKCSAGGTGVRCDCGVIYHTAEDSDLLDVAVVAASPRPLSVLLLLSQMRQSRGFHVLLYLKGIYLWSFIYVCVYGCKCMCRHCTKMYSSTVTGGTGNTCCWGHSTLQY